MLTQVEDAQAQTGFVFATAGATVARRPSMAEAKAGLLDLALDAALKGAWVLHCHHLHHMATGMMTEVVILRRSLGEERWGVSTSGYRPLL